MSCLQKKKNGVYYLTEYCVPGTCEKGHTVATQHPGKSLKVRDKKVAETMRKVADAQREEKQRCMVLGLPMPTPATRYTLKEFIDAYMKKHEELEFPKAVTRENYGFAWLHFMRSLGPERLLNSLTRDDMESYYKRAIKELSMHTVYSRRLALRALFNDAVKRGWLATSPMPFFPVVPKKKAHKAVTDRNVMTLLRTVAYPAPWPMVMEVVYLSACRISDMCRLKRRWIDRTKRQLSFEEPKEGETRYLYLTDDLLAALNKLERTSENLEYVVTFRGQPVNRNQCYKHFIKIGKLLGVHLNPHKFRHSRATHLADSGARPKDVMQLLGHSSLEMTEQYFQEAPDRQKEIAHLLSLKTATGE